MIGTQAAIVLMQKNKLLVWSTLSGWEFGVYGVGHSRRHRPGRRLELRLFIDHFDCLQPVPHAVERSFMDNGNPMATVSTSPSGQVI